MLNKRADKLELLRIAEAVALEKSIDKELIINSNTDLPWKNNSVIPYALNKARFSLLFTTETTYSNFYLYLAISQDIKLTESLEVIATKIVSELDLFMPTNSKNSAEPEFP